jgi:hypothetical protein
MRLRAGLAMVIAPTRAELAVFHAGLEQEYAAFAARERLPKTMPCDAVSGRRLRPDAGPSGTPDVVM